MKFDPSTLQRLGVRTAIVGSQSNEYRLELPGTIEYASDLYAEVGTIQEGRVQKINAKVGDGVKRGQVLATLLVPAIATAQADALTAQAALKVAREHARRETTLLTRSLTTARESEVALGEVAAREAELAAAAARLKLLGASVPSSETAIRPDGTLPVVSPIEGTVVARAAVIGSYLEPNETAFAVADTRVLWASLDAFESDLPYIAVGGVHLTTDSLPGKEFQGSIETLEPQLGRTTRASRAGVVLANTDGSLRAGLFVRASVEIKPPATAQAATHQLAELSDGVVAARCMVGLPRSSSLHADGQPQDVPLVSELGVIEARWPHHSARIARCAVVLRRHSNEIGVELAVAVLVVETGYSIDPRGNIAEHAHCTPIGNLRLCWLYRLL